MYLKRKEMVPVVSGFAWICILFVEWKLLFGGHAWILFLIFLNLRFKTNLIKVVFELSYNIGHMFTLLILTLDSSYKRFQANDIFGTIIAKVASRSRAKRQKHTCHNTGFCWNYYERGKKANECMFQLSQHWFWFKLV